VELCSGLRTAIGATFRRILAYRHPRCCDIYHIRGTYLARRKLRTLAGALRTQAAVEQDPQKLMELVTEIARLLDEKAQPLSERQTKVQKAG